MGIKQIDQLLSTFLISALFFIGLSFYFVFTDFKILNLHNEIIFTYIVMPVVLFVYWLLGRLKLNILDDICKWF
jgi:FtsH-binding integral membrane protein